MRKLFLTGGLLLGAIAVINKLLALNAGPLETPLQGPTRFYHWRYEGEIYNIFYKSAGDGPPFLLVHSIHAAASSFEMRKVHSALADQFTVYTLDLLGFGLSDRPSVHYDADLYIGLIFDFVRDVIQAPANVVASSLSAAYVIENAARHPEFFQTLALVSPTGLELLDSVPKRAANLVHWILRSPVVGSGLFNLATSRLAIGRWLRHEAFFDPVFGSDEIQEAYYKASHQENARFAPAAAYSGRLNLEISDSFRALDQRMLIAWGREARWATVDQSAAFRRANPNAKLRVFDRCGILVHDECAEEFVEALKEGFERTTVESERSQS